MCLPTRLLPWCVDEYDAHASLSLVARGPLSFDEYAPRSDVPEPLPGVCDASWKCVLDEQLSWLVISHSVGQ